MSKIYASFADPSLAEKAAGALLDYGVRTDDISVIRNGSEDDYNRWKTYQTATTYGNTSASQVEVDRGIQGDPSYGTSGTYAPEANRPDAMTTPNTPVQGQFLDRSDPSYIYENQASDAEMNDPHYCAAEITSDSDYTERRTEMEAENTNKEDKAAKSGISTTTPGDAGAGAAKGAGIGLGVGVLAALAAIFLPGVGLVIGGGALAAAVSGAVAATGAGAVAGAVTGYLKDQGVDNHVAVDYEKTVNSGGALLEVNLPSGDVEEATAREVLAKYGASNFGAYAGSARGYVS